MAGPGQGAMSAVFWGASAMAGQAVVDAVDGASVDARKSAAYQEAVERRAMLRGAAVEAAARGVDPRGALQGRGAHQLLLGPGVPKDSAAAELVDGTAAARAVEAALDPRERWVVENREGTMLGRDSTRRLRRVLWESGLHVNAAAEVPQGGGAACLDGQVLPARSLEARQAVARGAAAYVPPVPGSALSIATVPRETVTAARLAHVVDDLGLVGPLRASGEQEGGGGLAAGQSPAISEDPLGAAQHWLERHTRGLMPFKRVSESYVESELRSRLREIDLALEADDEFRRLLEAELGRLEEEEEREWAEAEAARGGGSDTGGGIGGGRQ